MMQRNVSASPEKVYALNSVLAILDEYVSTNRMLILRNTNKRRDLIIQIADLVYRCVCSTYQRECESLDIYSAGDFIPNDSMPFPPLVADRVSLEDLQANYYSTIHHIFTLIKETKSTMLIERLLPLVTRELAAADPDDDGEVSCDMHQALRAKCWHTKLIGGKKYLCFKKDLFQLPHETYRVLDGNVRDFKTEPIASVSANLAREIILLDPNSHLMKRLYEELKSDIYKCVEDDIYTILSAAIKMTRLYLNPDKSKDELEEVILQESKSSYDGVEVILLDDFIRHRIGVCRHNSLLLAYFLDRLQADGILPAGNIMHARHFRYNGERHVWVMYRLIDSNSLYLVDSAWNTFGDINDPVDAERLRRMGYDDAIDKCRTRFQHKKLQPVSLIGSQSLFQALSFHTRVTQFRKLVLSTEMQLDHSKSNQEQALKIFDVMARHISRSIVAQEDKASVALIVPVSSEQANEMYYHNLHANKSWLANITAVAHANLYSLICYLCTQTKYADKVTFLPLTCLLTSVPAHGGAKLFQAYVDRDLAEIVRFIQQGNTVFGVTNLSNPRELNFGDDPPKWWDNNLFCDLGFVTPYRYLQNKLGLIYHECRRINPDYTVVVSGYRLHSVYNRIENILYRMLRKRSFMKRTPLEEMRLLEHSLCLIHGKLTIDDFYPLLAKCKSWRNATMNSELKRLVNAAMEYAVNASHSPAAASRKTFD